MDRIQIILCVGMLIEGWYENNFLPIAYVCLYMYKVPYLYVLNPGSNTRSGSNICRVVQQNERNRRLGSFKCWVPKLLNLINLKIVLNHKEN